MTTAVTDPILTRLTDALRPVAGLVGLALGGSRARGTATAASDYDLALYYDAAEPLATDQLGAALAPLIDHNAAPTITPPGAWGPWINGGAWLSIDGHKIDLLYRDLARVRAIIADGNAGTVSMDYQPGHPHGFCSAIWIGEVALCRPLHDPAHVIGALKAEVLPYPDTLRAAMLRRFAWEVAFSIDNAATALARGDQTHIAGCAYRALSCLAQVLFALNGRYLINEKGALAEAATFPATIAGLQDTVDAVWRAIGGRDFPAAIGGLRGLAAAGARLVADADLA
ncbi:nucleotidyltransferase domain-containing protein [Bradyrhizobium sp. U87765 SZCCT0131]|nr:nucleotidyltransferase domain-containing protein [Bradyrhizobium sp. U87765 SZCCT0131]MBR1265588.1 nucleotidyltransferase domain-containing protein [Bradyrhizobium sp. U87765 SZCCT0134]MBR1304151.1 nucleotidyltransferase domain-containing protein [Bradyrhizobium sp. U87765 SZCCT0110]MBR1319757.1 nucleotidyltransferase domain-containing protein [Bradyrhizobium sp. U87765 SZCCT0109]MBR1348082.1 nucleotidyltransferase domain-containing protein [Bradyrhizobium sp. U87765 SZCCT0048]